MADGLVGCEASQSFQAPAEIVSFDEVAEVPPSPIATEALERIETGYWIEAEIRGKSAEERRAVRHEKSQPVVDAKRQWFEGFLPKPALGSPTAGAIRYDLSYWAGLERLLVDGRVELDSNTVEHAIRPVALSRKNSLFAGSDEGDANWAAFASLIETC